MAKYDAVLMLSGGIDSALLLQRMRKLRQLPRIIYFDWGRTAAKREIAILKRWAFQTGFPLEIFDFNFLQSMMAGHMEFRDAAHGEADIRCDDMSAIPALIGFGVYYAKLTKIEHVQVGLTKEQMDARPGTYEFFDNIAAGMTKFDEVHAPHVTISAPLADMTKPQIVKEAFEKKVDFNDTWSCLNDGFLHCGECDACQDRKAAFMAAEIVDKTEYRK